MELDPESVGKGDFQHERARQGRAEFVLSISSQAKIMLTSFEGSLAASLLMLL